MKCLANTLRVELKLAEKTRKFLIDKKLIREDLRVIKDKQYIYFPLVKITDELSSYTIIKKDFDKIITKPKSYKEILKLPDDIKDKLPTSYDVVGEIILIKISEELSKFQNEIGDALLKANSNIKSVYKIEPVKGEFRTRKILLLSGEENPITVHKEYGLSFNLDVQKTYFSPRLANERKRVAKLVKPGEIIVDMFAGVAPFSIMIAKYADPKIIFAIDKNADAIRYAKQNIVSNNFLDKIEIINADVKDIKKKVNKKADRIIMNLPFSAHLFFIKALDISNKNCTIHYYDILGENEFQGRINVLKKIAEQAKFSIENCEIRKIKSYTPREFYIGIDITANKMPM